MNIVHLVTQRFPVAVIIAAISTGLFVANAQEAVAPRVPVSDSVVRMDDYVVTGTRPNLVESTTFKSNTKVIEMPRSVTVIDATRLQAQDFQNADDVSNWIPRLNANAGSYHFFARGFRMGPSDWKVDGFTGRVVGGSYSPNLFGFEQVVALKGPAGILYGSSGQPGGQISLVSKKPRERSAVSVTTRLRTFAGGEVTPGDRIGWEVELDATGPVDRDGRLLYRLLASVEDAAERPAFSDDNQFHRAAFTYRLDRAGRFALTPSLEWSREDRAERNSSISPSSSRTTSDGRTDYTLADASPRDVALAAGGRVDDNLTAGFDLTARLSDAWQAAAAVRWHDRTYRRDAWLVQTGTLAQRVSGDPGSWVVSRRHTRAGNDFDDLSFDANISYAARLSSAVADTTQIGLNLRRSETQAYTAQNGANQSPVNLYTGVAERALVGDAAAAPRANLTRATAWNFYLQNRTTIQDRFIVSLTGGYVGDRTEVVSPTGGSGGATNRDSGVTPNLGLVYLLSPKASPTRATRRATPCPTPTMKMWQAGSVASTRSGARASNSARRRSCGATSSRPASRSLRPNSTARSCAPTRAT